MDRRGLFAALVCVAACSGSKLGGGDGGTAGTVVTGQGGAVGAGGDGAGGDATGGSGMVGTGGTAGTAGAVAIGGRGGAIATGGRGGSFSVAGDAGSAGPCASTPPDAPDGGFSPPPPDAGRSMDGLPACSYKSCSFGVPAKVPFDDASLGFTATDLLGKFASTTTGQLTWYDGTSTTLHFQVRYDQPTVQIMLGDQTCRDMLVDGAIVSLTTDDGRLSGDDFPGRLTAGLLGDQMTMIFANLTWPRVADLHGSFRAPNAWAADAQAQTLTLGIALRSETCSACAASSDPRDPRFSDDSLGCAYDGKIAWNGNNDPARGCTPRVTVAAWRWSQP
jgi:hypothetical protein